MNNKQKAEAVAQVTAQANDIVDKALHIIYEAERNAHDEIRDLCRSKGISKSHVMNIVNSDISFKVQSKVVRDKLRKENKNM